MILKQVKIMCAIVMLATAAVCFIFISCNQTAKKLPKETHNSTAIGTFKKGDNGNLVTQRIGVAVADHPAGPWKRIKTPLIDISNDPNAIDTDMTCNPTVTRGPDGKYLMVYKCSNRNRGNRKKRGIFLTVATADSPLGPFKKSNKMICTHPTSNFTVEDPFVWYQGGKYRLLVDNQAGKFVGCRGLVLFESVDGLTWTPPNPRLVSRCQIHWEDGTTEKVRHLERPYIWLKDGKPAVLYASVSQNGRHYNVHIPLQPVESLVSATPSNPKVSGGTKDREPDASSSCGSSGSTESSVDSNREDSDTLDLGAAIKPMSEANIFKHPDWHIWGGSIIKGDDGKYYLFYSRWLSKLRHSAWLTDSEIAVASSDSPCGPWTHKYTALKSPHDNTWSEMTRHNPKIYKFGDTYYLYFMATNDNHGGTVPESSKNFTWHTTRNNQRTGVAYSKSLLGPWTEKNDPVIVPKPPVHLIANNAAVASTPEGDYLMIIKGDIDSNWRPGIPHVQGLARSKTPLGPFEILPQLAIKDFNTEDMSIWYDKHRKRYYGIFHAYRFIGLITSEDGLDWKKAKNFTVTGKTLALTDGSELTVGRLERPFVYVDPETNTPACINMSALKKGVSFNVTVPLK